MTENLRMRLLAGAGILEGQALRVPADNVYVVYRPADALEVVSIDSRSLVRFAYGGPFVGLLLDPASGRVVEQVGDEQKVTLVNTSLDAFVQCLDAFASHFPLCEISGEWAAEEQDEKVAQEMERSFLAIDSEAYVEGSFWFEIRWDVAIGDFR